MVLLKSNDCAHVAKMLGFISLLGGKWLYGSTFLKLTALLPTHLFKLTLY